MKSTPGSVQLQEGRVNYQEYFLDKMIDKALGELFFKTYYMLLKEFIIVEVPIYITTNRIKHTKSYSNHNIFLKISVSKLLWSFLIKILSNAFHAIYPIHQKL